MVSATGIAFITWPLYGTIVLSLVLGAYLTISGVLNLAPALRHRRVKLENWRRPLLKGSFDLLLALGIAIMIGPGINVWIVGVIVGVELVFEGLRLSVTGVAQTLASNQKN